MAGPRDRAVDPTRSRATARRYLLDSETLQFAVRRHWASLLRSGSVYAVLVVVALAVIGVAHGNGPVTGLGLLVLVAASTWFAWHVGDWWVERFTVTDRRVLLISGLLTRRVAIMPLRKVTDLTYERTVSGRLMGYGAFVMESAGQHQALSRVDYLPRPEDLYQQMSDLLFGSGRGDWDPDEDGPAPGGGRGRGRGGRQDRARRVSRSGGPDLPGVVPPPPAPPPPAPPPPAPPPPAPPPPPEPPAPPSDTSTQPLPRLTERLHVGRVPRGGSSGVRPPRSPWAARPSDRPGPRPDVP